MASSPTTSLRVSEFVLHHRGLILKIQALCGTQASLEEIRREAFAQLSAYQVSLEAARKEIDEISARLIP